MKTLFLFFAITVAITDLSFAQFSNELSKHPKHDNLAKELKDELLQSLKDENGKSLIPENVQDIFQTSSFTGASNGDEYGFSVSSAGDVNGDGFDDIVIGAESYSSATGRAYIYLGGTSIDNVADVILTGESTNNFFGCSVSGAGDVNGDGFDDVIAGAYGHNSNTGRAYVYFGGASMNNVADVILTGEISSGKFGNSVSAAGNVNGDNFSDVIVGAWGFNSSAGRAYIYFGGASMNNVIDKRMSGSASNDFFGYSVSNAGDVNGDNFSDVLIGAYGASTNRGRTYVFLGGANMDTTADLNILGAVGSFSGRSVSTAGDVNNDAYSDIISGADFNGSSAGTANIYLGGAVLNATADVTFTQGSSVDNFGCSVSNAGDVNHDGYDDVIIGAKGYSSGKGKIYIYYGANSMNGEADAFKIGEANNNFFGMSVSNAGDINHDGHSDVISGAYGFSSSKGKAYLYIYGIDDLSNPDLSMDGDTTLMNYGWSVSSAGDVNGDGYQDVIVGATSNVNSNVYIYFGGAVMNNVADIIITGIAANDQIGNSVASAGDVNGDGFSDVIAGAFGHAANTGRTYIYFGGASMNNVADVTLNAEFLQSAYGYSVSSAGDVNGDTFSDVIVGAYEVGGATGRAYIYYGGASMNTGIDVTLTGESASDYFGISVSKAGDVNGDNFSDVIVGAYNHNFGTGRSYIFYGGAAMNNVPDVILDGENTSDKYGGSVSNAGDVNGDGFADVIVGADTYNFGYGKAYIYFGGSSMNNVADVTIQGPNVSDRLGYSVAFAGDVNSDGYSDVAVATKVPTLGFSNVLILFGGLSMDNGEDINITSLSGNSYFGNSVACAGDVNGDGNHDIIIGAPIFNNGRGRSYIYFSKPKVTTNIRVIPEGLYDASSNQLNVGDTVNANLRSSVSPYNLADTARAFVNNISFTGNFRFVNAATGSYYIVVKHRNSIETWSSNPVSFVQNVSGSYDFTTSVSRAYGDNQKQVDVLPVRAGIYTGDENQDGNIDVSDIVDIYNEQGNSGYVPTDLNGDEFVDVTDLLLCYNNSIAVISVITP